MSIRPWNCEKCERECSYLGIQLYPGESDNLSYGVGWGCATCDYKALDVCPLGPLVPSEDLCLNCGIPYELGDPDVLCPGCGLSRLGVLSYLRLGVPTTDPVATARDDFGRGLF